MAMTLCTFLLIFTSLHITSSDELSGATINDVNNEISSATILADLLTDQMKSNGFVFLNDSSIGENISIDTSTSIITGLESLSDLVTNISTFYMDEDLLSKNTTFSYTLGNVAGRCEIARGINKVSGAPKQVLVTAHSEASYLSHAPLYLIFACPGIPNITTGGQTIVYSIEKIMDKLMETEIGRNLLHEVGKYGVIYMRNDPSINDPILSRIWHDVNYPTYENRFAGHSKPEITNLISSAGQNVSWINGNILHTEWKMAGFRLHPISNKIIWFNQLYAMNGRYFDGHNVYGMNELELNERPLNTLIGNGRQLSDEEYELLEAIHTELAILIPWDNTGDVLAIDNFQYQHGRMPYNSYRNCVINWGQAVKGGEYIYSADDFNTIENDIKDLYKLVDKLKWYDTVFEYVFYRDVNDKNLFWWAKNSEEISSSSDLIKFSIPKLYKDVFDNRDDINVIFHVHNPDIAAIGMSIYSFLPIDQSYYMLLPVTKGEILLGNESKLLLIPNNGMLVMGNKFDETFTRFFYAIRAAQSQTLALNIHNGNINNIIFPSQRIQDITRQQSLNFNSDDGYGYLEYIAWKRRYLESKQSFKNDAKKTFDFSFEELNLRKEITKAYHILDKLGYTESIYQHITGVVNENAMLINAYGLEFGEVNINNLMKVTMNGSILYSGNHPIRKGYINPSGLALHAAVHEARPDAKIVIHCHHPVISAISVYKYGLLMDGISYHEFDSLSLAINKTVLSKKLNEAPLNNIVILRNHGIITMGENVKDAFNRLYHTIQNAKIQIRSMRMNDFDPQVCKFENKYVNVWNKF